METWLSSKKEGVGVFRNQKIFFPSRGRWKEKDVREHEKYSDAETNFVVLSYLMQRKHSTRVAMKFFVWGHTKFDRIYSDSREIFK